MPTWLAFPECTARPIDVMPSKVSHNLKSYPVSGEILDQCFGHRVDVGWLNHPSTLDGYALSLKVFVYVCPVSPDREQWWPVTVAPVTLTGDL